MNNIFDADRWREVWMSISRNKRRSFITAFGVFWGIFMLVVMLSAGNGLWTGITSQIEDVPYNACMIWTNSTTEAYMGFRKGRYWDMKQDDIAAVKAQFPEMDIVSPVMFANSTKLVRKDKTGSYNVKGLPATYPQIVAQNIYYGRYINKMDVLSKRKVCVLGKKIYDELFIPGENPIGEYIKVGGVNYQIIGVTDQIPTGINLNGRDGEAVAIPYSVVQQVYNRGDVVHMMMVTAKRGVTISDKEDEITALIRSRHSISPTDKFAVQVIDIEKIAQRFEKMAIGISLLTWLVGVGTLLAGAIGVSNIVMITVKERTKEIGVRRAMGAKPFSIISQIMSESLVLTVVAGFFGLAAGVGSMAVVSKILAANPSSGAFFQNPQMDFTTALVAALIIVVCGLLSGILPAWRALQIKAIDAIREE